MSLKKQRANTSTAQCAPWGAPSCSFWSHTASDSKAISLIKEWIIWLFIQNRCWVPTLPSTEDTEMSKTGFFLSFCRKHFLFILKLKSTQHMKQQTVPYTNCTATIKKAQMSSGLLPVTFYQDDWWAPSLSRLFLANCFQRSKRKKIKQHLS